MSNFYFCYSFYLAIHLKLFLDQRWASLFHFIGYVEMFQFKTISILMNELILFQSGVPLENGIISDNKSPYILAIGNNQREIQKFIIVVEHHFVDVRPRFMNIE